MNPAVAAVLAARGRAVAVNRMAAPKSRSVAPTPKVVAARAATPAPRNKDTAARAAPAKAVDVSSSRGKADAVASAARRARNLESVDVNVLQKDLEMQCAAAVAAALRNQDAAALAAAFGREKTPAMEKMVRSRKSARMAAAIEKRDAAALLAIGMSSRKSGSFSGKEGSTREVNDKSGKVAALASARQSEKAGRPVSASKSEGAVAPGAAVRRGNPPVKSSSLSTVSTEAATVFPSTSGGTSNVPSTLRFDSAALMASLDAADREALIAAQKSKDVGALRAILKSASVAPVIAKLRAKGFFVSTKGTKSEAATPATDEGLPVTKTVVRPDSTTSVNISDSHRPRDKATRSSSTGPVDVSVAVSVKSGNSAALAAALKSENAGAIVAALKSGNSAALSAELESRLTAISPKSKVIAARALVLKGKVSAALRTKSAAAKAAAAKLKAAATTLAARKAKKRVRCQEPVLCVFELDMRCPWHTVYVPDDRHVTEGDSGGAGVPKEEIKTVKEEADEDREPARFSPLNKKMKMEVDELTPNIVGEVEMKMDTMDDAADDMASVSGSGNQADLSTESTLSATSPRADDYDMDDDCRDVDVDVDAGVGEVMLQPPLGADEADLVAVAQGVAMVGAQEEVIQQDDDSLTNPPVAVDEVEVS